MSEIKIIEGDLKIIREECGTPRYIRDSGGMLVSFVDSSLAPTKNSERVMRARIECIADIIVDALKKHEG